MVPIDRVTGELERIAPLRLAAEWDAVGLLVGSRRASIARVMTCLTLTPAVAAEAVQTGVDLVVSHHPLPFRPVARLTAASATGRVLLDLMGAGIAVWSGHTAWDSAAGGINDQIAALLRLEHVTPITPDEVYPLAGVGRAGAAAAGTTVRELARRAGAALGATAVELAGAADRAAGRVGIICGSGGDLVADVAAAGCQTFLTGELKLHEALAAVEHGLAVIAVGHHASERFSMDVLGRRLAEALPGLEWRPSSADTDPFAWQAI
ncbi:MAG: Nif3-like dinuclear metal center hexameric protein [Planctomycetia bacterium]|nr:Nif3-like dinuclear metal center hexameric protein [Planctomycetia bacterium]